MIAMPSVRLTSLFTVLTVDDTEAHSYALGKILQTRGYRVLAASCGSEALLLANRENPNLILLDVNLPDMNGYQVCRQLKSSPATEQIPVLMYSSQNVVGNTEAELSGATGFLTYPVESTILFPVIDGTLARIDSQR